MNQATKFLLISCIITFFGCAEQVINTVPQKDLFPNNDNSHYSKYIEEAINYYTFNPYDYELAWEEIEYNPNNVSQNVINYYSLVYEKANDSIINKIVYRNNKVVGLIETLGLYKVYFTPIGGEKKLIYDFSVIIERASGVYYKPKNCNGDLFIFPAYREDHITDYIPDPLDISGRYLQSFFSQDNYRTSCVAEDINQKQTICGIGRLDGILNIPTYNDYSRKLIQLSLKDNLGQWLVLYNLLDYNYYDYINEGIKGTKTELLRYIPKTIWREEFKYRLTHTICM